MQPFTQMQPFTRNRDPFRHACLLFVLLLAPLLSWNSARAGAVWDFGARLDLQRMGLGAAAYSGRVYVVGGLLGATPTNKVEISDNSYIVRSWGNSFAMPSIRAEFGMTTLDDRIYAVGGWNGSAVLDTVLTFNPQGSIWSTVAPLSMARRGVAAAASGGKLYAIGGATPAGDPLTSVEVYDPLTNAWTFVSPMHVARYYPAASTGADGRIYVVGGQAADGSSINAAEVYDPATDTWSFIASTFYGRFGCAAATGEDGKIYALGGSLGASGVTNTVEAYNPETNAWTFVAPMNSPRALLAAVARDGYICVAGGYNPADGVLSTTEAYRANFRPSVSGDKTVTVAEDAANTPLMLGAGDTDGDPVTIVVNAVPTSAKGDVRLSGGGAVVTVGQSLTLSQLGALEFDPAANANGSAGIFRYTATDGQGGSASQTATLEITSVNDAPAASNESYSVAEEGLLDIAAPGVLANDTDADGDPLTAVQVAGAAHGALTLFGDGSFFYQPNANYSGPDSFTYRAKDAANAQSTTATVTLNVTGSNDPPTAAGQGVTTSEDTAKSITLSASDPDGDSLTYTVVATPAHGTLSGTGAARTYTPAANYNGPDSFTFKANDGSADSVPATVSITVTPTPDPPVALDGSALTPEDMAVGITLAATEPDGDPLTYSVVTSPAHGALTGSGASRTYTPASNYSGADTFTFRVNDGTQNSNLATVTLLITSQNDPPVATGGSITLTEDTPLTFSLTATDADGDPLAYSIVTFPAHGTLSGVGASRTYTPAANFSGDDAIVFQASDGTAASNPATLSITVAAANDAPVAIIQSVAVTEDTPRQITLAGTDVEGSPLTYTVLTNPAHGTLSGTGANRTYVPAPNYSGADSFTFRVNDGAADSAPAAVSLQVTPVNDPPVALDGNLNVAEDASGNVTLGASDADGDNLTFTIVTPPTHGTLTGSGSSRTYIPAADYHGADSFTFRASDGQATSNTATVELIVTPTNDAPVATSEAVTVIEATATPITLTATDPDGDPLTYTVVGAPAHGSLTGSGASRTYTPLNRYNGTDSLAFRVSDGKAESAVATISATVLAVIDPPVVEDDRYETAEDQPLTISAPGVLENDWPGEGGALTAAKLMSPAHGVVTVNANGSFTYTPTTNYSGPDSFTYRLREGQTNGGTGTVTLTVTPVNDAPVVVNQTVTVDEDSSAPVTLSAVDAEGDAVSFTVVSNPTHGTLSGSGANRIFTPAADFNGSDSFTYRASDGAASSSLAVVTIDVAAVNDPPVANAGPDQTREATGPSTSVNLDGTHSSDPDGETLAYTWRLGTTQLGTGATLAATLPVGEHVVLLTVTDPAGSFHTDTVAITVRDTTAPTLALPTAPVVPQTTLAGATVNFTITATDLVSTATVLAAPASGTVFPPGQTTVSVTATDAAGNQKTGSFTVTVTPPTNTPGKLTAKGAIPVQGKSAKLTLTAQQVAGKPLKGSLSFTDPVSRQTLKSTSITALVITGTRAQVFGEGTLSNRASVQFVAEAEDLGTGTDRFRLELSDGRVFGPALLSSGSVTISR